MTPRKVLIWGLPSFILISAVFYFIYLLQPISTPHLTGLSVDQKETDAKTFIISPQTGFREIAGNVYSLGLIRSKTALEIYAAISGKAGKFKPGAYRLYSTLSTPQIVKILAAGPESINATIIPGMTLKEIDDKLSNLEIIERNALINFNLEPLKEKYNFLDKAVTLEGFLLPDTYYFLPYSSPETIVNKFLDNFAEKVAFPLSTRNQQIKLTNYKDLLRLINLSSLLEKEIPYEDERQIVAGILEKRLRTGMALQIDATIVYAKCAGRFSGCPGLEKKDYKINSLYNTYLYPGLPPTPISNPSIEAIEVAANPVDSDYWYYLSDPKTKKTIFSKTLDEHNQNRIKYLLNK